MKRWRERENKEHQDTLIVGRKLNRITVKIIDEDTNTEEVSVNRERKCECVSAPAAPR